MSAYKAEQTNETSVAGCKELFSFSPSVLSLAKWLYLHACLDGEIWNSWYSVTYLGGKKWFNNIASHFIKRFNLPQTMITYYRVMIAAVELWNSRWFCLHNCVIKFDSECWSLIFCSNHMPLTYPCNFGSTFNLEHTYLSSNLKKSKKNSRRNKRTRPS